MDILSSFIQFLTQSMDIVLHLDVHLAQWASFLGPWLYVILFIIIFCETGLVVTPFLPGDSLLFAAGALTALEASHLSIQILLPILVAAAFLGDNTNYWIGKAFGDRILHRQGRPIINPRYLEQTNHFYQEHGGKTVFLARFLPIMRTFAPFVAGLGAMGRKRFVIFSLIGSVVWIGCFLLAGHFFGNIPSVKKNFHYVILGVLIISFAPVVFGFVQHRLRAKSNLKA